MTDNLVIYLAAIVQGLLAAAWLVERSHRHDTERIQRKHTEELQAVSRRATDQEGRINGEARALDQLYQKTNNRREKS